MKRKVGIVTIIDYLNYGNRLQNYAMQELLCDFGFEVETVRFTSSSKKEGLLRKLKSMLLSNQIIVFLRNLLSSEKLIINKEKIDAQKNKKREFKKFSERYISFSHCIIRKNRFEEKYKNKYDFFVAGSDQIWNPTYRHFDPYITYLCFAEREKRIAISPSFGIDNIPPDQTEKITQCLKGMKYISVREKSGADIVKSLTGLECDVFLDPTMLIHKKHWKEITDNTVIELPKKYVLTYFLGNISQERKKYIEHYASVHNAEIIEMNCLDYKGVYSWGPDKFLKAIQESEMFFTDSFHGCVFSMIFHKQFAVFKREDKQGNMFGRIDTLLNTMKLPMCVLDNLTGEPALTSDEQFEYIDQVMCREQERTRKILSSVFF